MTPHDVLRLQRLAGNGAVQHVLAPRPPSAGTPPVVQRQDRPPGLEPFLGGWEPLPVLPPPIPTTTIILVGSPSKPGPHWDKSPYNFSDAAVKVVPKLKEFDKELSITILFYSNGFKARGVENGQNVYEKARADLQGTGATVAEVTSDADVIGFLNTGLVTPADETPTRAVKVSRFLYFGHGGRHELTLEFGWGKRVVLATDEIEQIKADAFKPQGRSYLFTCGVAEMDYGFMSVWAAHLGQTSVGAGGTTAFNPDVAYDADDLDKAVNQELPHWFLGMPYMNKVKIIDADDAEPQP